MKNRKTITLSAVLYTMLRRWKVMAIAFVLVLAIGAGYTVLSSRAKSQPDSVAATVTLLDERNRTTVEGYKKYIENSAYMAIDPNNLHYRYIHYYINWKEEGVDPAALESKYGALFTQLANYYPSDEFVNEIKTSKPEYKDKALYEILGITRSGNDVIFMLAFSDDYYLKDMGDIIDATLKKKTPEWISTVGAFEFTTGPVVDKPVDGFQAGYKAGQDTRRALLSQNQAAIANAATVNKATKEAPLSRQLLIVAIIAILAAIVVGGVAAIYGRRLETATDVYDITGEDVLCVFKKEPESGLDKWFYKKNDKYHDPALYLSIADRKLANEGTKKIYIYNCSDEDVSGAVSSIADTMKSVEVVSVDKENSKDFFLKMADNEGVILLVKGGETQKRDFLRMQEHLEDVGVKTARVVFTV